MNVSNNEPGMQISRWKSKIIYPQKIIYTETHNFSHLNVVICLPLYISRQLYTQAW